MLLPPGDAALTQGRRAAATLENVAGKNVNPEGVP
jgi:hypothetical protein